MTDFAARFLLVPCILVFFLAWGCKEKPKNPVEEYGNTLIQSYQKSQAAAEVANLDAIKKAVQRYRAEHEEYPKSLTDIEAMAGMTIDPAKYDYDPATGTVALKAK
jgi:hypothetical protein